MKTKMHLLYLIFTCFMSFLSVQSAFAQQDAVIPRAGKEYECGSSFLVYPMQERISVSDTFSRKMTENYESFLRPKDVFYYVRLRITNVSHTVLNGLDPASFSLIGTLKGKPKAYHPVLVQETDFRYMGTLDINNYWLTKEQIFEYMEYQYFDQSDLYVSPDAYSYLFFDLEVPPENRPSRLLVNQWMPLRTLDLTLVFDVKPYLQNWMLEFTPIEGTETNEIESCSVAFSYPEA